MRSPPRLRIAKKSAQITYEAVNLLLAHLSRIPPIQRVGLLLVLFVQQPDGEDALVMVLERRTAVGALLLGLGLSRVVLVVRKLVRVP